MRSIERILVCMPPVSNGIALERAIQFARKLDVELDLMVMDPKLDQGEFLERLLKDLRLQGIRANGEQADCDTEHASATILETSSLLGSDLVIKQHHRVAWLKSLMTLPDDWHLARESKVPLLLVQEHSDWDSGKVLAAMDVNHHDQAHLALQGNVIDYASEFCQIFDANLQVVSAFPAVTQTQGVAHAQFERGMGGYFGSARAEPGKAGGMNVHLAAAQHCHDLCQWFQEEYELSEQQLHLLEGTARQLIPQVAEQVEASLVVLGTVARHGLFGALHGNAVETVLEHLHCDVLVLQPHIASVQRKGLSGEQAA